MSRKDDETPGDKALSAMNDMQKDIVFKKPDIPRKKKRKILDEDSYIEVKLLSFNKLKYFYRHTIV